MCDHANEHDEFLSAATQEELGWGARYAVINYLKQDPQKALDKFVRCPCCKREVKTLEDFINHLKGICAPVMVEGILEFRRRFLKK